MKLVLAEKPFRTLQGEGIYCGVPSVFVRLAGCNLRCQWINEDGSMTRCDTPHASWEVEEFSEDIYNLSKEIANLLRPNDHLVVTGGEPLLQSFCLNKFLVTISEKNAITIETNGTNYIAIPKAKLLSISPKLESSGNSKLSIEDYAKSISNFSRLNQKADIQLKYVVSRKSELSLVKYFDSKLTFSSNVIVHRMLMPQGTTIEKIDSILPWLAESSKEFGWRLTDRQHIRLFGGKRGT